MDKNITPTSDLASLDCWDYTIELECLRGPQGINTTLNTLEYLTKYIGSFRSYNIISYTTYLSPLIIE